MLRSPTTTRPCRRSSKSANYCAAKRSQPVGLLLLSEVALGSMSELTEAKNVKKLPPGCLSVKGLGRTAPDPAATITTADGVHVPLGKPKPTEVSHTQCPVPSRIARAPMNAAQLHG